MLYIRADRPQKVIFLAAFGHPFPNNIQHFVRIVLIFRKAPPALNIDSKSTLIFDLRLTPILSKILDVSEGGGVAVLMVYLTRKSGAACQLFRCWKLCGLILKISPKIFRHTFKLLQNVSDRIKATKQKQLMQNFQ